MGRKRGTFRCCLTNHRTRSADLDILVREVLRLGREIKPIEGAA